MTTGVEVLLFDGFDELDAVGPYEVLSSGADRGADIEVATVTLEPDTMVLASHGLKVVPDRELGRPDVLVVPGGGWSDGGGVRDVVEAGAIPREVARRHEAGSTVASVCTGAMVLAEGGVLDGRPATTHHVAHEDLAGVTELVEARVVDDGDVLTAGGITSGLDLALWLLEREFSAELAAEVAWELEYERRGVVRRSGDG